MPACHRRLGRRRPRHGNREGGQPGRSFASGPEQPAAGLASGRFQNPSGQSLAPTPSNSPRQAARGILTLLAVPPNTGEATYASQIGDTLPAVVLGACVADLTTLEHAEIGAAAVAVKIAALTIHQAAGHPRQGVATDAEDPVSPAVALTGVSATRAQRQRVARAGSVIAANAVDTTGGTAAMIVGATTIPFVCTAVERTVIVDTVVGAIEGTRCGTALIVTLA